MGIVYVAEQEEPVRYDRAVETMEEHGQQDAELCRFRAETEELLGRM